MASLLTSGGAYRSGANPFTSAARMQNPFAALQRSQSGKQVQGAMGYAPPARDWGAISQQTVQPMPQQGNRMGGQTWNPAWGPEYQPSNPNSALVRPMGQQPGQADRSWGPMPNPFAALMQLLQQAGPGDLLPQRAVMEGAPSGGAGQRFGFEPWQQGGKEQGSTQWLNPMPRSIDPYVTGLPFGAMGPGFVAPYPGVPATRGNLPNGQPIGAPAGPPPPPASPVAANAINTAARVAPGVASPVPYGAYNTASGGQAGFGGRNATTPSYLTDADFARAGLRTGAAPTTDAYRQSIAQYHPGDQQLANLTPAEQEWLWRIQGLNPNAWTMGSMTPTNQWMVNQARTLSALSANQSNPRTQQDMMANLAALKPMLGGFQANPYPIRGAGL